MEFADWEPVYERILADFGFDRAADERARDVLGALVTDPLPLDAVPCGGTVAVAGAGPALREDLDAVRAADHVFAASSAAAVLRDHDLTPDAVVTDLDGRPRVARALAAEGVPVVVHAHGDDVPALRLHAPRFPARTVLPTTQAAPRPPVENVGGFTDGDRAAFLADALGADALTFPGWDFDDPAVSPSKRHKLSWAARLLRWLERRRGERFAVLDGRRADLDVEGFP